MDLQNILNNANKQPHQNQIEEESKSYRLENIPIVLSQGQFTTTLTNATLQFDEESYTISKTIQTLEQPSQEPLQFTISVKYSNTTSIGSEAMNILIFIGDNNNEEEEEGEDQKDLLFSYIQQNKAGNFMLNDPNKCYQIRIDLTTYGKNVMKEVYDLVAQYLGEVEDGVNSQYDQDQDFSEMIKAEDIDQNGCIKNHQIQEEQSSSDPDEDVMGQEKQDPNQKL